MKFQSKYNIFYSRNASKLSSALHCIVRRGFVGIGFCCGSLSSIKKHFNYFCHFDIKNDWSTGYGAPMSVMAFEEQCNGTEEGPLFMCSEIQRKMYMLCQLSYGIVYEITIFWVGVGVFPLSYRWFNDWWLFTVMVLLCCLCIPCMCM